MGGHNAWHHKTYKQTNKLIETKRVQNCLTSITCAIVGREQRRSGGNESVWDLGCVYNHPGPGWLARVHAAVTGSEVPGSRVFLKKICEAELKWSTSGRRTMRASGLWNGGEEQYSGQGGGGAAGRGREAQKREPGGDRGEEELCVMSVFPRLSYFEMWLNGPPSVRQVPGSRAAWSPASSSERSPSRLKHFSNASISLLNLFK